MVERNFDNEQFEAVTDYGVFELVRNHPDDTGELPTELFPQRQPAASNEVLSDRMRVLETTASDEERIAAVRMELNHVASEVNADVPESNGERTFEELVNSIPRNVRGERDWQTYSTHPENFTDTVIQLCSLYFPDGKFTRKQFEAKDCGLLGAVDKYLPGGYRHLKELLSATICKPNGYYDDLAVLSSDITEFIQRAGTLDTPTLKQHGEYALLHAIYQKYGNMSEAQKAHGVKTLKMPKGAWADPQTIQESVYEIVKSGKAVTLQSLPTSGAAHAVYKYHGGDLQGFIMRAQKQIKKDETRTRVVQKYETNRDGYIAYAQSKYAVYPEEAVNDAMLDALQKYNEEEVLEAAREKGYTVPDPLEKYIQNRIWYHVRLQQIARSQDKIATEPLWVKKRRVEGETINYIETIPVPSDDINISDSEFEEAREGRDIFVRSILAEVVADDPQVMPVLEAYQKDRHVQHVSHKTGIKVREIQGILHRVRTALEPILRIS